MLKTYAIAGALIAAAVPALLWQDASEEELAWPRQIEASSQRSQNYNRSRSSSGRSRSGGRRGR